MDTKSEVSVLGSRDPESPVGAPVSHLGRWLWYVQSHLLLALAKKLEAHNVTVVEWLVLRELSVGGEISPVNLGGRLSMTRSSISRHTKKLAAKGLLQRRTDLHDRRAQTLILTAAGQRVVPALAALADRNDAEFFGHLPSEEQKTVRRILKTAVEHCDRQSISRGVALSIEFSLE
jgi:DNA-binding MarR family transcriptional regulator